jgi:hypothetical protein
VLLKELAGAKRELETVIRQLEIAKAMLERKDERIKGLEARVAEAEQSAQTSRGGEAHKSASPPEVEDAPAVAHGKEFAPANSVRFADLTAHRLEQAMKELAEKDTRIQVLEKTISEQSLGTGEEAVALLKSREGELSGAKRDLEAMERRFEIAKAMLERKDERIKGLEARVAEAEQSAQTREDGEG